MRSPFPGMDPYLEDPAFWPGLHNGFLAAVAERLSPLLRPRYYVALEQRVYEFTQEDFEIIGVPDIAVSSTAHWSRTGPGPRSGRPRAVLEVEIPVRQEVRDVYLEVHEASSKEMVTLIELLSPANKLHAEGRRAYLKKREAIFHSRTNLVEIDLLRAGKPMPLSRMPVAVEYRILVSRAPARPRAQLHAFSVRDPIPPVHLPLHPGEAEPEVDIGSILHAHHERMSYDLRIDYSRPPVPPLQARDAQWARSMILRTGRRTPPLASPRLKERRQVRKPSRSAARKARRKG